MDEKIVRKIPIQEIYAQNGDVIKDRVRQVTFQEIEAYLKNKQETTYVVIGGFLTPFVWDTSLTFWKKAKPTTSKSVRVEKKIYYTTEWIWRRNGNARIILLEEEWEPDRY
ncbi:MAG: hypothetical protein JSS79_07760 [Bacteroidetes bacterium]|nr:hypothetical protein [Bacteroidota bacterium]